MIYYSYLQGGRYVSKDYSLFGSMEGKQTSKTFDFTGGKTGWKNLFDFGAWTQPL